VLLITILCPAKAYRVLRIWLREVAETFPKSCEFYGFDISTAQFPLVTSLPGNVHFEQHNMLNPWPISLLQTFDLVHIRFVTVALATEEWEVAVKNLIRLLSMLGLFENYRHHLMLLLIEPGGYLQWADTNIGGISLLRRLEDPQTPITDESLQLMKDTLSLWGKDIR
jgi:hypothetical protein